MPQFLSTLACTMPQPRISSQSSPSPKRISPPERRHWMSTSIEGEVNGKEARAEAHVDVRHFEERLAELLQHPFQVGRGRRVSSITSPST